MLDEQMNKLFAEGGVLQQGGTVDPVSGNDVPPGAMAEEVRDDIDAKLSEGEFVFPADVVRYWGLEKLMMMRDKAKAGLKRMADIGQMGNAEEVDNAEAMHGGDEEMDDEAFSSEIDSIMNEDGNQEYSTGGSVRKYVEGGYVGGEVNQELYRDAPLKGFEMVAMTNDAGQTIYIPFINGKAQLSIPMGYKVKTADSTITTTTTPDTTSTTPDTTGGGGDGGNTDGTTGGTTGGVNAGISMSPEGVASPNSVSVGLAGLAGMAASMALGVPGLSTVAQALANQANFNAAQDAMNVNVAVADTTASANNEGVTTAAATAGIGGTGGAAAAAAASAAAAATSAGFDASAVAAASQAAATATVNGATSNDAAAIGAAAAVSSAVGTVSANAADALGDVGLDSGPVGDEGTATGNDAGVSGVSAPGGGEAPSAASDGSGAAAGVGTGGTSSGDSGDGGTGAASSAGTSGTGDSE